MTEQKPSILSSEFDAAVKAAVAEAIESHRKLGHSISIWRDGQVITLAASQIPQVQIENNIKTNG